MRWGRVRIYDTDGGARRAAPQWRRQWRWEDRAPIEKRRKWVSHAPDGGNPIINGCVEGGGLFSVYRSMVDMSVALKMWSGAVMARF
jgi:hypothetical protein